MDVPGQSIISLQVERVLNFTVLVVPDCEFSVVDGEVWLEELLVHFVLAGAPKDRGLGLVLVDSIDDFGGRGSCWGRVVDLVHSKRDVVKLEDLLPSQLTLPHGQLRVIGSRVDINMGSSGSLRRTAEEQAHIQGQEENSDRSIARHLPTCFPKG